MSLTKKITLWLSHTMPLAFGLGLSIAPTMGSAQTWAADSQYTNQPALATVKASDAYLNETTGAGVAIGIIDTGVNPNNSAISGTTGSENTASWVANNSLTAQALINAASSSVIVISAGTSGALQPSSTALLP